jgi:hypothetical protein
MAPYHTRGARNPPLIRARDQHTNAKGQHSRGSHKQIQEYPALLAAAIRVA